MKKNLLLFVVSVCLASCTTTRWYSERYSALDYSIFNSRGITVSPFAPAANDYCFLCDAQIEFLDGYTYNGQSDYNSRSTRFSQFDNNLNRTSSTNSKSVYKKATNDEMMAAFADWVIELGGDAVFDFGVSLVTLSDSKGQSYRAGWRVSGVVAKTVE